MPLLLDLLEASGELVDGQDRYSHQVRREPGVYERDKPLTGACSMVCVSPD